MSKELVSAGLDHEIIWFDRAFGGARRSVLKINGSDGSVVFGGLTISKTGDVSIAGASITGGAITADTLVTGGKDLTAGAGNGILDWSLATGIFSSNSGTNTLNGNVVIAGTKTFTTGTGAVTINGAVSVASGVDIVAAGGASDFDYSLSSGIFKTPSGQATFAGSVNIASGKDIVALGGASDIDYSLSSGVWKGPTGLTTWAGKQAATASANVIADPGTGLAIPVTASGVCMITTAAAETNTLAIPTFIGQRIALICDVYAVGDRVITSSQSINQANNTIMTFGAAADMIVLEGMQVGGALRWRVVANDGVALS